MKNTEVHFTLTGCINIAKKMTIEAAAVKDWQISNKKDRAMREIARQMCEDRGYIIATTKEFNEKFGRQKDRALSLYEAPEASDNKPHIWAIRRSKPFLGCDRYYTLEFVAIR